MNKINRIILSVALASLMVLGIACVTNAADLGELSTEYQPGSENNPYHGGYQSADSLYGGASLGSGSDEETDRLGQMSTDYQPSRFGGSYHDPYDNADTVDRSSPYKEYDSGPGNSQGSDRIGEMSTDYQPEGLR